MSEDGKRKPAPPMIRCADGAWRPMPQGEALSKAIEDARHSGSFVTEKRLWWWPDPYGDGK